MSNSIKELPVGDNEEDPMKKLLMIKNQIA